VSDGQTLESWLHQILAEVNATSGTVHVRENDGLRLAAAVNIPPPVQQIVQWVPNGKGMAGLAMQRGEPIQTCNLQEDRSGNVKPGAKAVNAQAAIAIPVQDSDGDVLAVVGIAFQDEREFTPAEIEKLKHTSSSLRSLVRSKTEVD
jgi:L-methionine (R)-S-oxide reductase